MEATRPDFPTESSPPEAVEKYRAWEEAYEQVKNKAAVNVAKQRHGSTGNVPLLFQSEFTKFTSPNMKDYSDWGYE